jgi:TP901 family phage tail tape measure protein
MPASDVIVRFIAETKGFDLTKLQKELAETKGYAEALNTSFATIKTLAVASGASLLSQVLPMVIGSKVVADYNTNISLAAGINDTLAASMEDVNSKVNAWAIEYGVSADDISSGILAMVKADQDWKEITENMDPALQLAIANNMELADVTDTLVKVTALWGDENLGTARMANMLQVAAKESILDVSDLGEAIRASGSQASVAGVEYAEFLAAASSLSNIGAKMGYNWGTFYTRILTTKDKLAEILGDDSWLTEDGGINFTSLIGKLTENLNNDEVMQGIAQAWGGQRSLGAAIQAGIIGEGGYQDVLAEITGDTTALQSASDNLKNSINNTWTRIQEAVLAPLRDEDVMKAFETSLNAVAKALTDTAFTEAMQTLMLTSADFVTNNGVQLVDILIRLMQILVEAGPTLTNMASWGIQILGIVSQIPTPLMELLIGMYAINKVLPGELIPSLIIAVSKFGGLKAVVSECGLKMMGLAGGFAMVYAGANLLNSDNPSLRFLGMLVIALGAATAAWSAYSIAMAIGTGGTALPIMAASAAGAVAVLAGVGLAAATSTPSTSASGVNTSNISAAVGGVSDTNKSAFGGTVTYTTINNYQANTKDTLYDDLQMTPVG